MTISEPITTGRFFAYPSDAVQGAILPYWVAAGGTYARMSAGSRRAFCAVLEAILERAVIPTLTSRNWVGGVDDMSGVSPTGGIMHLAHPDSDIADPGARAEIASSFVRGADENFWHALVKSAFAGVGSSTPLVLDYDWYNSIRLYPFALGAIGGGTTGFSWSSQISMTAPAELCECVWHDSDRDENPLYDGSRTFDPSGIRALVDDILRGIGSTGHSIGVPSEASCDLGGELQKHYALSTIYNADTVRNWWTPPFEDRVAVGPSWITPRRSNVAYGVAQMMVAMMNWTMCRFRYALDFVHKRVESTTTYILAMDDGILKAIRLGDPVVTEDETSSSSISFARGRTLGAVVCRVRMRIRHPNNAGSPLAKTEAELTAVNPNFPSGSAAVVQLGGAAASVLTPTEGGESGELLCWTMAENTEVGDHPTCMNVWPHPSAGEYVDQIGVVLFDRVDDMVYMSDIDGGRTPRETVFSVRQVPTSDIGGTVSGHASWLVSNCGVTHVDMPEEVVPDAAYLARYGVERGSQVYVAYIKGQNEVVDEHGQTKYLPFMAYFGASGRDPEFFDLDGDMWEALGEVTYAPDPEFIWGGERGVDDHLTHSYGDGIAQVRWRWRAMPASD